MGQFKNSTFDGNVVPSTNNTKNLGTSSKKWKSVYATDFVGSAHNSYRLKSINKDERVITPSSVEKTSVTASFVARGNLTGTSTVSDFADMLILNTWGDNTGGYINALTFNKRSEDGQAIFHYQANNDATKWNAPKQIAYTDSTVLATTKLQTARKINGVAFDGTKDITVADNTKLPLSGGAMTGAISTVLSGSWLEGLKGTKAIINSTSSGSQHTTLFSGKSTNGRFIIYKYNGYMGIAYSNDNKISNDVNGYDRGIMFYEDGSIRPNLDNALLIGSANNKFKEIYATTFNGNATNATKVNNHTVESNVPANAKFTDTIYPIYAKNITTNFSTQFRTQTKGNTNAGDYITTIRNNTNGIANAPLHGSGLAFGRADTHGYLYLSYAEPQAYLGGGNADTLKWISRIAFMDNVPQIHSGTTTPANTLGKNGDIYVLLDS